MAWYRQLRMIPKIVLPVGLMLILALGLLTWQIQSRSSGALRAAAERELAALAGQNGNAVKSIFEVALNEAQGMADGLSYALGQGGAPSREEVIDMLRGIQIGNSQFMGTGTAFEPNAYDGNDADNKNVPGNSADGRFMPYLAVGQPLEPLQDLESSSYYADPKKRNASFITEPYLYDVGGKKVLLLTTSAAIKVKGQFKGIVLVDLAIDGVGEIVNNLKIYESGKGAVITQEGLVVAHPDSTLIMTNLLDSALVGDSKAMREAMKGGKPYSEIHTIGGVDNISYYFPIYFDGTAQTWYFSVSVPVDEVMAAADEISLITLILCGVTLLLSLIVIFLVVRASLKPLGVLAESAHEIAGGNLQVKIDDAHFGGEMLDLSTSLKNMITSLIDLIAKAEAMSEDAKEQTLKAQEATKEAEAARIAAESAKREGMLQAAGQLEDVVNVISSASEQLSAQVEQSERGSSVQAARVAETATAMEEMNSTVLEVARSAGTASELSGDTRARAEDGARIVRDAVAGIRSVQEVSLQLKDDMGTLSEQAESISNIMGVISDIADQTNLLALNAAIEAARAGEYGRGFAVVADEVRKLAEKTMVSTKDVGQAISSVQSSVRQSISQVDRAVALIDEATEKSGLSGEALEEIVHMVDNVADQVRAIATASEEQSSTSEEINHAVAEVNTIAEQTAQAMQEASKAVSDLSLQTHTLGKLIEDMKNS